MKYLTISLLIILLGQSIAQDIASQITAAVETVASEIGELGEQIAGVISGEGEAGEAGEAGDAGEAQTGRGGFVDQFFLPDGTLKPEIQNLCNNWIITLNRQNNSINIQTPPDIQATLDEITEGEELPTLGSLQEELAGGITINGEELSGDVVIGAVEALADAVGANAEDVNAAIDSGQAQVSGGQ